MLKDRYSKNSKQAKKKAQEEKILMFLKLVQSSKHLKHLL